MAVQRFYDYRRNLPHIQPSNATFFITFCTSLRSLLTPSGRDIVLDTCLRGNGHRYDLHAIVAMPDHVHLALTPKRAGDGWTFSIPDIMQELKSVSAHRINKETGHSGRVWQEESFDRAMRTVEDLNLKIDYLVNNPVRAGIVDDARWYRWLWIEARRS